MLVELRLENLALIESQSMEFGSGLNVISGETGTGKSVVLNALKLILGGRGSSDLIRSGADSLSIQALFDISSSAHLFSLPEQYRDSTELLISREISRSGRNRVYINGALGSVSVLKAIGADLVQLCGQSQQVRLVESDYQLTLLDQFAGVNRSSYGELFGRWSSLRQELADEEEKAGKRAERELFLRSVIEDLEPLGVYEGLRKELELRVQGARKRAEHLELLYSCSQQVNASSGPLSIIERLKMKLQREGLPAELIEHLESASVSINEFDLVLSKLIGDFEYPEGDIEQDTELLAEIARFERKYRCHDSGLVELLNDSLEDLEKLASSEDFLEHLRTEVAKAEKELRTAANQISKKRKALAKKLASATCTELAELNMADAEMEVEFTKASSFTSTGIDKIEFRFSMNGTGDYLPLKGFASGGELSRIMLVLKKLLKDTAGVNVLVFDEVDSGVSGRVARAVGEKLYKLATDSQVICVTHLAQVASVADHHFRVRKTRSSEGALSSQIEVLEGDQVIDEIARMLAGYDISPAARASAEELVASKPIRH